MDEDTICGFVNSRREGDGAFDRLQDLPSAKAWLTQQGWLSSRDTLSARDLSQLVSLREAIRQALLANMRGVRSKEHLPILNAAAARANLHVSFAPMIDVTGQTSGVESAFGAVARAAFWLMAHGDWPRLKACGSDTCHWAFFDTSKNGSRTWCSMTPCGNRMKARAFRARQKEG